MRDLDRRISVAPMMDWTDRLLFSLAHQVLTCSRQSSGANFVTMLASVYSVRFSAGKSIQSVCAGTPPRRARQVAAEPRPAPRTPETQSNVGIRNTTAETGSSVQRVLFRRSRP